MRVLICSDTHKKHENFIKVIENEGPFDLLIHCGDTEGGEYLISQAAGCHCEMVLGNNDYFSALPREALFQLGGKTVWVVHGHTYYVSLNLETIKEEARLRGADVVMFGHTHRPVIDDSDDVLCINPGSLSYPRQMDHRPTYIILTIDKNDRWHLEQKYIEK